jgi:hypothetical protein
MQRVMSTQKLPIVGDLRRANPRTMAMADGDTNRRRDELLNGEGTDLREVRHRRLSAVVLPVGVGQKRHRRVEAQRRSDGRRGAED